MILSDLFRKLSINNTMSVGRKQAIDIYDKMIIRCVEIAYEYDTLLDLICFSDVLF